MPADQPKNPARRRFAKGALLIGAGLMVMAGAGAMMTGGDNAVRVSADPLAPFQEGVHFVEINKPFDVGHNHVREWMSWGCVHCATFEPVLKQWLAERGSSVVFERSAAPGSKSWNTYAAMYEVAASLGDIEKMHPQFMDAVQRKQLDGDTANAILTAAGVDPNTFWERMETTGEAYVKGLMEDARRSGIPGTPTMVIGGRYRILTNKIKSFEEMLEIADYLIDRDQKPNA